MDAVRMKRIEKCVGVALDTTVSLFTGDSELKAS
jgi:hypothetical protein